MPSKTQELTRILDNKPFYFPISTHLLSDFRVLTLEEETLQWLAGLENALISGPSLDPTYFFSNNIQKIDISIAFT